MYTDLQLQTHVKDFYNELNAVANQYENGVIAEFIKYLQQILTQD